ncbi:hypothetical protein H5410_041149 [Solanum commersonii]|uniref:Uncharacterized protein n=1 Tax=Solanum commersonii TaxID=4109 RepID=A0A9J5XQS3_SOLCO|nr:hypothetical protein H5410_041149 [Solanum commersonii]
MDTEHSAEKFLGEALHLTKLIKCFRTSTICWKTLVGYSFGQTYKVNDQWVREFYVNLMKTDMTTRLITIQFKVVNYKPKIINVTYGLLDHDIEACMDKDCESGAWITSMFCQGKNVSWVNTKAEVEVLLVEIRVEPKHQIFPLKMPCEGTVVKSKKRKGDSGNYIRMEEDSSIPPVLGPFEPLASELKIMKDIVTNFPQRLEVKGLWKVLNENDPLTTLRTDEDGYEPFTWNDDGGGEGSGATDTKGDD